MTTTVKIRLLWHKQTQFAGYLLAEKLELARNDGIDIVCEPLDFEYKHVASILSGSTPMAVASPAHILESTSPEALRWILTIQQESPLIYPVRKGHGIECLADLKGHKVGVWPGDEDLEFRWMLHRSGLKPTDVQRIPMPDTVEPFLANNIASGQMTNYHELHAVEDALGMGAIELFSAKPLDCSIIKDGLVVSTSYATEHPSIVQAVVNAVLEGWTMAFDDPDRAIALCMEVRPDVSESEHRRQLADIYQLTAAGATLNKGLGYPDPQHLATASMALSEVKGKDVDTTDILDLTFWESAPERFRQRVGQ